MEEDRKIELAVPDEERSRLWFTKVPTQLRTDRFERLLLSPARKAYLLKGLEGARARARWVPASVAGDVWQRRARWRMAGHCWTWAGALTGGERRLVGVV